MEKLNEQEKADFAAGMRAASTQAEDTYKVVAVLKAIENDLPKNFSINGADIRRLVADLEGRGVVIPGRPVSDIEVRSLRGKVSIEMPKISLRGIPFKGKAQVSTPATYDANESLKARGKMQEQMFLLELAKQGDSVEALEQRMKEKADPLMKLVNARTPKRK